MKAFLIQWLCTTVAVAVAVKLTGMHPPDGVWPLVGMALFLGVVNALLRPFLLLLSLPFILATLGLFILFLNAMLFALATKVVGLRLDSPWQAIWGALIVSVVNWILSWFFRPAGSTSATWQLRVGPRALGNHGQQAGSGSGMKRVEGRVIE